MRSDDHVVERQQARQHVVAHDPVRGVFVEIGGLLLVNVQPRRTDLLLFQPVDQRPGMDQLPAALIDTGALSMTPGFIRPMASGPIM